MKTKILLSLLLVSSLGIYSCKKDGQIDGLAGVVKLADVNVPDGFTWESSRDINFKIAIADNRFQDNIHVIAIYSADGGLITKGAASLTKPFESKAYVPRTVSEVFVVKTAPDNSSTSQKIRLDGDKVTLTLSAPLVQAVSSVNSAFNTSSDSPDCTTGCSETITLTTNSQTVSVSGGKTICVNGSNKSFDVQFGSGGGTLRICGTNLTIQELANNRINDPMAIIITADASVTFDEKRATNFNQNNNTLENYGHLTIEGGINLAGKLKNFGVLTVNGEYSTETQTSPVTEHTNNGTLIVNGQLDVGSNSFFYNNGSVKATDLRVFNHATFINNCKLLVTNEYDHSTLMKNYGYIKVDGEIFVNGSSELALYGGSMISTRDIKINGTIKGYDSGSLFKVSNETELTGAGTLTGNFSYCDANGLEKNNGTIEHTVSLNCNLYIPVSGCNAEGNGSAPVKDTDGDGVLDNIDDYPHDATKAFNNYYPGGGVDDGATILFEDMWPVKGDYDMNDIVMSYQLKVVTNAANKVVELSGSYSLNARGGIFENGFGIEFPINRSLVSNVKGAILEEGQDKAVLILFTNMQNELPYMNTRATDPFSPAKTYMISFSVTNGPSLSEFGLGEYNPFIWNRGKGRSYEVHLPGHMPTSLGDPKLFGSGHDASNPSKGMYYVTSEGFPWAISVPVKNLSYPLEGMDIGTAYLKLSQWVMSGGVNFNDWYSNRTSGYRNENNFYKAGE
ncbi:LruC domain-containing protein [Desertivirga xinjiangensis]|uniref:LruC domain-containing protein n=1 Tax=Desertivirga xinjiangensis TaxID=539206 RepID=UPI002109944E|nr:LruC domain-containing protein [Pedobacter xinjiangensis]